MLFLANMTVKGAENRYKTNKNKYLYFKRLISGLSLRYNDSWRQLFCVRTDFYCVSICQF